MQVDDDSAIAGITVDAYDRTGDEAAGDVAYLRITHQVASDAAPTLTRFDPADPAAPPLACP